MKIKAVIVGVFLTTVAISQQLEELKFVEIDHDFGEIKETDGPAQTQFDFTNISTTSITITNVRASCGCTTPGWTKEPVLPGETGFIKAVFDPNNRPGPFHKTLTVTTNGKQSTIILRIQGRVEPKPRTIEDDFPTIVGALRTKYRTFNMGKVFNNEPGVKEFLVYNQSDNSMTFSNNVEGPDYITVSFNPQTLEAKEKGKVIITYNAAIRNDLGFMTDNIVFYTDEIGDAARKSFSVYADLNEYFAPLTEEEAKLAPKLIIAEKVHSFGSIQQGESVSTLFTLKNEGKSDLIIRKTHSSCSCTSAKLNSKILKAGELLELEVTFNSTGRRGNQQKSITIYSNDPIKPVQRLTIMAKVKLPPANN